MCSSLRKHRCLADIMSTFGTIAFLYLPNSAALAVTGAWLGWNTLFAGVLLKLNSSLVIWKYWAYYLTPFYNVVNTWMRSVFYGVSFECPKTASRLDCYGGGDLVLDFFGYETLDSGVSVIILFSTLIGYALILCVLLIFRNPRA